MGYYIFSYAINSEKVLNSFNSKDEKLINKVKANDTFENYADFEVDNMEKSPKDALSDIINGNPFDQKSNYAYGYAIIGICATLGLTLPYQQEIKLGVETDLIDRVLTEDFKISNFDISEILFSDQGHTFPIPKIDDWPLIGLIKYEQLISIQKQFADIDITEEQIEALEDDPDEKEFAYEHIKGIIENIKYCVDNQLDLVSFCH